MCEKELSSIIYRRTQILLPSVIIIALPLVRLQNVNWCIHQFSLVLLHSEFKEFLVLSLGPLLNSLMKKQTPALDVHADIGSATSLMHHTLVPHSSGRKAGKRGLVTMCTEVVLVPQNRERTVWFEVLLNNMLLAVLVYEWTCNLCGCPWCFLQLLAVPMVTRPLLPFDWGVWRARLIWDLSVKP